MLTADRQYGTFHDWLLTFNNTSQIQNKDKVIFYQDKCGKTMVYSTLVTAVSKSIDFAQNFISFAVQTHQNFIVGWAMEKYAKDAVQML